jgi:hypothetical protein
MTTRISDSEIYINTMDIVEYLKRFNTDNKELDVINEIKQIIQTLDNSLNNNYKSTTDILDKNISLKINNIIKYHKYLLDCGKQDDATRQLKWSIDMLMAIKDNI